MLPEEHLGSWGLPLSLADALRPHLCSYDPYPSLLPPLKGSGIWDEPEGAAPGSGTSSPSCRCRGNSAAINLLQAPPSSSASLPFLLCLSLLGAPE